MLKYVVSWLQNAPQKTGAETTDCPKCGKDMSHFVKKNFGLLSLVGASLLLFLGLGFITLFKVGPFLVGVVLVYLGWSLLNKKTLPFRQCESCNYSAEPEPKATQKAPSKGRGKPILVIMLLLIIGVTFKQCFDFQSEQPEREHPTRSELELKCELRIEQLALHGFRWRAGDKFRQAVKKGDIIELTGDAIDFKTALGGWSRHWYTCKYSIEQKGFFKPYAAPGSLQ